MVSFCLCYGIFCLLSERLQLQHLAERVKITQMHAIAPGTLSNYRSACRTFFMFCAHFHVSPLPASAATVNLFLQFISSSLSAAQSVDNYLSAIRFLHKFNQCPCAFDQEHTGLSLTVRGIHRLLARPPKQKLPMSPSLLETLLNTLELSQTVDVVYRAAFTINFFTFARKSNVVPPSMQAFDCNKHMCRDSITVIPEGLLVHMNWSKTNQFHKRKIAVPLCPIPGSVLCPVDAWVRMCDRIPARPSDPAFLVPCQGGFTTLTHKVYTAKLHHICFTKLGIRTLLSGQFIVSEGVVLLLPSKAQSSLNS